MSALGVGEDAVLHDLEKDAPHVGMGLLDLIEKHHRIGPAPHLFSELSPFVVAHIARRGAQKPGDGVLFHILRHVEAEQGLPSAEQGGGQGLAQLGLAHAGGAQERETRRWAGPGPSAPPGPGGPRGPLPAPPRSDPPPAGGAPPPDGAAAPTRPGSAWSPGCRSSRPPRRPRPPPSPVPALLQCHRPSAAGPAPVGSPAPRPGAWRPSQSPGPGWPPPSPGRPGSARSSSSRRSGGVDNFSIRTREAASSIRSTALSGRKRSGR